MKIKVHYLEMQGYLPGKKLKFFNLILRETGLAVEI